LHVPSKVDVGVLRRKLGLSQAEFALRYGLTVARVRDWEQKRSTPDAAARAYLKVIEKEPEAVKRALATA
jgi:putative transcriptional regulator